MTQTLADMRTRLRARIGNPGTSTVTDAALTAILNEARDEIADEFKFHKSREFQKFPTVIGVDKYALPPEHIAMFRLWDETNQRWIKKYGDRLLAEIGGQITSTGAPLGYIRFDDGLMLLPCPDAVYNLAYFAKVTIEAMVANDDTSLLPATWDRGIGLLARHIYWDDVGDGGKADAAWNRYRIWVTRKPGEVEEESRDMEVGCEVPTLVRDMQSRSRSNSLSSATGVWAEKDQ